MYWQRTPNGSVRVLYYEDGKPRQLPRKLYKHLDPETIDSNIDYWVAEYARAHFNVQVKPENVTDPQIQQKLESFVHYLRSQKGLSDKTVSQHRTMLERFAIPYFLGQNPPLSDPNTWPGVSVRMFEWMDGKQVPHSLIPRVNSALKQFYKWMAEEGVVHSTMVLRLRGLPPSKATVEDTPLKRLLAPAEVIDIATRLTGDNQLILLLGYFFSLRSQEVFALRPCDFKGGSAVDFLESSKTMRKMGLFPRLALNVHRQRLPSGKFAPPKKNSKGWVSCFNETAARMVVAKLKGLPGDEPLFKHANRFMYKVWLDEPLVDFSVKDLRRASLYWLGHHSEFQSHQIELMKHARHKRLETTMLYLRRPTEALEGDELLLDLDA